MYIITMAKLRIFVSSTYYDLRHIRNSLSSFIEEFGYDPVLFESGDIPYLHDISPDESSYKEIDNCNMLILIIGGRYGSPTSYENIEKGKTEEAYKFYNSITKKEYEVAREKDIPIFIFVEKGVYAEYQTYKKNRDKKDITYAHVDNVNIFLLLDSILMQRRNNFIKDFEKFDEISSWLKDQWAGLFADFLTKKKNESEIKGLSDRIADLESISNTLKTYAESIIKKVEPDQSTKIIETEQRNLSNMKIIRRFMSEKLINFILGSTRGLVETKDREDYVTDLYKKFLDSDSLEKFINSIAEFNKKHKEMLVRNLGVQKDFTELKSNYAKMES